MHPALKAFTDRHDVHEGDTPLPDQVRFDHPFDDTNKLLKEIAQRERDNLMQICLTDREPPEYVRHDFPCKGIDRFILRRTGEGGDFTLPASTPVQIVFAAEYRIGVIVSNISNNVVKLFLTEDLEGTGGTMLTQAVPIIGLPANSGPVPIKINETPWCGNIIALATAQSEVTVAAF